MVSSSDWRKALRESELVLLKDIAILDSGGMNGYLTMKSNLKSRWSLLLSSVGCLTNSTVVLIDNIQVNGGGGLSYLITGQALYVLRPGVLEDNIYKGFSEGRVRFIGFGPVNAR